MKPRFSISNLLLLTAIVGILIAWILDHRQLNRRYQDNYKTLTDVLTLSQSTNNSILATYDKAQQTFTQLFKANEIRRADQSLYIYLTQVRTLVKVTQNNLERVEVK